MTQTPTAASAGTGAADNKDAIFSTVIGLMKSKRWFSDIQIKIGQPIQFKGPRGYVRVGKDPITREQRDHFLGTHIHKDWSKLLLQHNGSFQVSKTIGADGEQARLRCQVFYFGSNNDVGAALRVLSVDPPDFTSLGLPPQLLKLVDRPRGLFLIGGPTGAGKSTTMVSLCNYLNTRTQRSGHLVTIENPIEYEIKPHNWAITQHEIPTNKPSFAAMLREVMREDPDVIAIGEVRDRDTAEAAMYAGESGHFVFATLHANSTRELYDRFLLGVAPEDLPVARTRLAQVLVGSVVQTLMPSADDLRRVLAYELVTMHHAVQQVIRTGKYDQFDNTLATSGRGQGVVTISDCLAQLVLERKIRKEDAVHYTWNEQMTRQRLGIS